MHTRVAAKVNGAILFVVCDGSVDALSRVEIRHLGPNDIVSALLKPETTPRKADVFRLSAFEMNEIERLFVRGPVTDVARSGLVPLNVKEGPGGRDESQRGQGLQDSLRYVVTSSSKELRRTRAS